MPAHTLYPMPRYEYRCRACGDTFEMSRAMSEANAPAECPAGHDDTVKLLSTIALTGRGGGAGAAQPAPGAGGGGCCGGGCGCG
jgi:putative FmdB family regulatory protein